MKTFRIILAALAASIVTPSFADSAIYGLGGFKCADYIKSMEQARHGQDTSKTMFIYWAHGYITAEGERLDKFYGDITGMDIYMENYCQNNPMAAFLEATKALVDELSSR